MTRKLITVGRETSPRTAAGLLLKHRVPRLPVTSPEGQVNGIVTWKDILSFYTKK